jgi:hypothetical protein
MFSCLVYLALGLAPLNALALPRPAAAPAAAPDDDFDMRSSPEAIVIAYGGLHNDTLRSNASSCSYFEYPAISAATAAAATTTTPLSLPAISTAAVAGGEPAADDAHPSSSPPPRAYAAYTLLAAHGWSSDCDALTRSIARSCATHAGVPKTPADDGGNTSNNNGDVACDVVGGPDAAAKRVLINVHVPGAAGSECGAAGILEASPDARASNRVPPACKSPMPTTTTTATATSTAAGMAAEVTTR